MLVTHIEASCTAMNSPYRHAYPFDVNLEGDGGSGGGLRMNQVDFDCVLSLAGPGPLHHHLPFAKAH